VLGDLTWAKAAYHSIRGLIVSEWELKDGEFRLKLVVPANTTARVHLPVRSTDSLKERGKPLGTIPGIEFLPAEMGCTAFHLGSGEYHFRGPWNRQSTPAIPSQCADPGSVPAARP
jgi:alpha-L-rhamnosidase